jgi:hypothetical protein
MFKSGFLVGSQMGLPALLTLNRQFLLARSRPGNSPTMK